MKSRTLHLLLKVFLVVVSAMPILSARAQTTRAADFFVAENPTELSILNRYLQKISRQEERLFQPFVPMEVVDYNATLSDNFTRCMTVRIGESSFFLLRDDDNALTNDDQAGYIGAFRNCSIVDDTIRVLLDDAHSISPRFSASDEIKVVKGELVKRLFRKDRSDFVQILGRTGVYGWAYFSARREHKSWEKFVRQLANGQDAIPERVRTRVQTRIREINQILQDLFAQLNTESVVERPVPQWQIDITETLIVCTINEPDYAERFSGSMQYIVNDLDNVVRGTEFAVRYSDGLIEIKKK